MLVVGTRHLYVFRIMGAYMCVGVCICVCEWENEWMKSTNGKVMGGLCMVCECMNEGKRMMDEEVSGCMDRLISG